MKSYFSATLVTLVAAAVLVAGFMWWKDHSAPHESEKGVVNIEGMEKNGLMPFSATTLQGEQFKLENFKGKSVVLNFWASWCGPCVEEFPSLLKLAEELHGQMILIAVSGDSSREEIDQFMKQLKGWDKPWVKLVWDQDRSLTKLYDVERLPESFVTDRNLHLVKKIIGSVNWYTPDSVQYMNEVLKK